MSGSPPVVIYLHGFNSSPDALKAQQLGDYLQQHHPKVDYRRPYIPGPPDQAVASLSDMITMLAGRRVCLVGSSLGGFYASWLAARFDCRAVLVNPAVAAHRLLQSRLGQQRNPYSGEQYELTTAHMQTLQSLCLEAPDDPRRFLLLVQMADEVLDARAALRYYRRCQCLIEPGGNHRFAGFQRHLPLICSWFELE